MTPDIATIADIPLKTVAMYIAYWIAGWSLVNNLLPPRETFNDFPSFQKFYNVLLLTVAYWGALNLRKVTVGLYGKLGVEIAPAEHEKEVPANK